MAFDISSIQKGKANRPPRMIVLGTPKVGKTTFACGAPDAVLIPVKGEEGADDMDCAKFPVCESFDDVMAAMGTLAGEKHEFGTVIIDSTSALEPLVWDKACQDQGWSDIEKPGYGKGYVVALGYWRKLMECLDYLRNEKQMASILIGHVTVRLFNDPLTEPYDAYEWDIQKKAAAALTKWADCVLFARQQTFQKKVGDGLQETSHAVGTGKHMLYTQERPAHPGGGRGVYGKLPYEVPLSWGDFEGAVVKAMKEEK